jgi:hypothetical protein
MVSMAAVRAAWEGPAGEKRREVEVSTRRR